MRILSRVALTFALLSGPMAGYSSAVTIDDLFNLQANGLSDDLLVALIATDGSSFQLSATDIIALYKRGLSEKVILAMVASGQRKAPPAEAEQTESRPAPAPAPAPTIVNVHQTVTQRVETSEPVFIPVPIAVPVVRTPPASPPPPTYWGFGGTLRPDAWGQPAAKSATSDKTDKSDKSDKPASPATPAAKPR